MSTEKKVKNYIKGGAKEVTFDNGGSLVHIDILTDAGGIVTKNGNLKPNEKGYVKLTLSKLPQPDAYGNTHTLYENEWKPTGKAGIPDKKGAATLKPFPKPAATDDLPF